MPQSFQISYTPPLSDIRFIMKDVLDAQGRTKDIVEYSHVDWDTASDLLDTVADYSKNVAFPLNQSGDKEGCHYDGATGAVTTPKGFKSAFDIFRGMGVGGLTGDPLYDGGLGFPNYVSAMVNEPATSANFSLGSYLGLTGGAAKVIEKFGSDEIKKVFLPLMYAGDCTGTMCLTETQAGSDLGLVKTTAKSVGTATSLGNGAYEIKGTKIFITCGEHDLSSNIAHLVLARLPNAPAGTRGISLFLVPKFEIDANGVPGASNNVKCGGIEHKMGINASSTCIMNFDDGAKGWLIGQENKGMKAMFTMMNDARLKVALQGLSSAELCYQNAAKYADFRVQGKLIKDAFNDAAPSVNLLKHSNIRKDLMDMKSQIEGWRALAYETAIALDLAEKHPDAAVRDEAENYAALMTPVLKACLTDLACAASQKTVQIFGGTGYIRDTGVEQYYRDSLISTIYEGTNDIQAIDFTFRKVLDPKDAGRRITAFVTRLSSELATAKANPLLTEHVKTMEQALQLFQDSAGVIVNAALSGNLDEALVHSRDFTNMFGKLAVGGMWLKIMGSAKAKADSEPATHMKEFYEAKLAFGENYLNRIMLPEIKYFAGRIQAGAQVVVNTAPEVYLNFG